ncbi:MAG: Holliday junction branch migration protein RuvA [bacterium]
MIVKLIGKIDSIFNDFIIVMNQGIGYKVEGNFPKSLVDDEIVLFIHHHIREQEQRLFGFITRQDYLFFEKLLLVPGIGPKGALSLINNVGVARILEGIDNNDASIIKAPGIGHKIASRLIIELRPKLNELLIMCDKIANKEINQTNRIKEEVGEALLNLGYSRFEIQKALELITIDNTSEHTKIIKEALTLLKQIKHG